MQPPLQHLATNTTPLHDHHHASTVTNRDDVITRGKKENRDDVITRGKKENVFSSTITLISFNV